MTQRFFLTQHDSFDIIGINDLPGLGTWTSAMGILGVINGGTGMGFIGPTNSILAVLGAGGLHYTKQLNIDTIILSQNNITSTLVPGVTLQNVTASTGGATTQNSPAIKFQSEAFYGGVNNEIDWYILAEPQAALSKGYFSIYKSIGGVASLMGYVSTSGVLSMVTGYQINSAAPSSHFLKGDGTNYIDGVIVEADLPSSVTSLSRHFLFMGA